MSIERLEKFIYEAPIAYDDESEANIGKLEKRSKTKWGSRPPKDISQPDLMKWIGEKVKEGILSKEIVGQGRTRAVNMNDGKTVFKYNWNVDEYGNQTEVEVAHYNKIKNTPWKYCVPKIYDYGTHWSIQERAEEFSPEIVKSCIGLFNRKGFDYNAIGFKLIRFVRAIHHGQLGYEEFFKLPNFEKCREVMEKIEKNYYDKAFHDFLHDKRMRRVMDFAYKFEFMWDLKFKNLGKIGNNFVMVDYGLKVKYGSSEIAVV